MGEHQSNSRSPFIFSEHVLIPLAKGIKAISQWGKALHRVHNQLAEKNK